VWLWFVKILSHELCEYDWYEEEEPGSAGVVM
jgi:hypothetical protein